MREVLVRARSGGFSDGAAGSAALLRDLSEDLDDFENFIDFQIFIDESETND